MAAAFARGMSSGPPRTCGVHLAPRMLAASEDEPLVRACKLVGWSDSPSVEGAKIVFNVCNPLHLELEPGVAFSRFPGMADCCRKALFAALLGRLRRLLPSDSHIGKNIPQQWALPQQRDELKEHFDAAAVAANTMGRPRAQYIIKPDSGCRGNGRVDVALL